VRPQPRDVHLVLDNYATDKTLRGQSLAGKESALQAAFHPNQRVRGLNSSNGSSRDHVKA